MSATILAVDGGNSSTDAALVAADGTLLAHARGPGANHQTSGPDAPRRVIGALVARLAAEAGLDPTLPVAEHGWFYLAGADLPGEVDMLRRVVTDQGWVHDAVVDNDTFALLRAGSEAPDRVAVVCGAGINCVGVSGAGGVVRFPALGRVSGDWGGGTDLGAEALWLAARDEDGRGAATALREAVTEHFGMSSVAEVSVALHLGELPAGRLHELVPVLLGLARAGDALCAEVVARQGNEVALLAVVALSRLELLDSPVDVVLGGGVLASGDELLLSAVRGHVLGIAPKAVFRVVREPPVVGAALLGLDATGACDQVRRRAREALLRRVRA